VGQHEQVLKVAPVTDQPRAADRGASARPPDLARIRATSDAKLLDLVRDGNIAAYEVLCSRHVEAARRLAQIMVFPAEVDHVVAESFAEVRDATLLGRGPADAFRPYLLAVLRRVGTGWPGTEVPADTVELPAPGEPASEPEMTTPGRLSIVRAFRSLPERWITVLWHTEIEETRVAEVARILGLSLSGVERLRRRALEGLRQAYLDMRMSEAADMACQAAARRFAAFLQNTTSRRDRAIVMKHLGRCGECRAVYAEFTDIELALHKVVAHVVLGAAADSYLYAAHCAVASAAPAEAAVRQAGAASSAPGAKASASAGAGLAVPVSRLRHASVRLRWLGASAAGVLAVAAAFLVVLAGAGSVPAPAHRDHNAQAAPGPTSGLAQQPTQTPTVPATPPSASPAPADTSPANVAIAPLAVPAPEPAQLSATVDVGPADGGNDRVAFAVTDTGGTATGDLVVSLDLPGSSLVTGRFGSSSAGTDGWTCQQTQSGATCQHDGIQAGGRAQGSLLISISNPQQACGQAVSLTAVSGSVSDSAQSPEGIQCQR
jgi:DNA-directed RNA polymerase specialized sigma24 family protein